MFTKRSLLVWTTSFFAPTVYLGLLAIGEFCHLNLGAQQTRNKIVGILFYLVPFAALVVSLSLVLFTKTDISRKTAWVFFTCIAMVLQLVALIAAVFFFNGFEGIQ